MRVWTSNVEARVVAPASVAFEKIAPIELARIFRGYGLLPAVVRTRDQPGAWDAAAGQTRTVELSDGSMAREQLLTYEVPRYFAYRVGLQRSTTVADRWGPRFIRDGGDTIVRWRYAFDRRSWFTWPVLGIVK